MKQQGINRNVKKSAQKRRPHEKPTMEKLMSEVEKSNPEFVRWLKGKKIRKERD